jgi:hypothetical protein
MECHARKGVDVRDGRYLPLLDRLAILRQGCSFQQPPERMGPPLPAPDPRRSLARLAARESLAATCSNEGVTRAMSRDGFTTLAAFDQVRVPEPRMKARLNG